MAVKKTDAPESTALTTTASRFTAEIERQFASEMGASIAWTDYERTLAQHLFLRVDSALKELEKKRDPAKNQVPMTWENVNLVKLALDGVHRVALGLDALMANHIHPIPYLNGRTKKYDVDLRIGYAGKDFCRRLLAIDPPVEVIYELVYATDVFRPIMRSAKSAVETYEFEITNPFNRGKVIGGFGYIAYAQPAKNRLVLVTERDFEKARKASGTDKFWGEQAWEPEMKYKTIVHRVADKIPLDPRKVNAASYAYVEEQEADAAIRGEIAEHANREIIDIPPSPTTGAGTVCVAEKEPDKRNPGF